MRSSLRPTLAWRPSPTDGRRPGTSERARRAVACLLVLTEILVMAWAGAGTITVECRLVSPFGEHRVGITAWVTRGAGPEQDRQVIIRACPGVATPQW